MPKFHIVVQGDRLDRLSTKYYGISSKFENIIQANNILVERRLQNRLAADGLPILYAGDNLTIPDEVQAITNPLLNKKAPDTIDTDFDNAITVLIGKNRFQFFTGFSIKSSIGSFDTLNISSPYSGTPEAIESFKSLSFNRAVIYYGKDLFFDGVLLAPIRQINENSETLSLNFYPKCGVLANSSLPLSVFPVEYNGLNLKQIIENVSKVFSIKVEFIGDPGAVFEKVSPSISGNVLSFIIGLAKKRGFLITNNKHGDLLIWKATDSIPTSFVIEGELPFVSCVSTFDPQKYYSEISGLTDEKEISTSESYTWENPFLKNYDQYLTVEFNDIDNSDLKESVEALAGRMFGSAGKYSLVLNTHRDSINNLFEKNQTIRALAPKSDIYKETNFLIETSILSRQSNTGDRANLSLVLPGAYTGKLPEGVPWLP